MPKHKSRKKTNKQTAPSHPVNNKTQALEIETCFTTGRVILLFVLLTVIFTFPLVLRMDGWIMGVSGDNCSDIFAAIWQFWSAKVQLLELGKSPFRFDLTCGPYSQSPIYTVYSSPAVMIPFTAIFGPIASLNIFVILNFVLGGVFTWLLVRELTGSTAAGIVPGIAFAFCPFAYARAIAHVELAPIWVLPFFFYALSLFNQYSSKIKWIVLVLALSSIFIYLSPYFYLIIPIGIGSWIVAWCLNQFYFLLFKDKSLKDEFGRISHNQWIILGTISVILATGSVIIYQYYLKPIAVMGTRPIIWQERFALSLSNYLLPTFNHPIWSDFSVKAYSFARNHGMLEQQRNIIELAVNIGWVPLILAGYGLSFAHRDWRSIAFVIFGVIALSITMGPYLEIGGVKIPMPSLLIHDFAPFVRAIGRYSVFVMLSVSVLTGYGIKKLIHKQGMTNQKAFALISGLSVLVGLEFAFPTSMMQVPKSVKEGPEIYARLMDKEKDATIFEYPPVSLMGMPMADYFFFQTLHHRKLFNRYFDVTNIPDDYFPFWQDLDYNGSLSDPASVAGLKYFQVDYVLVHEHLGKQSTHWSIPSLSKIKGLELVDDLGKDKIYKITANPAKALLFFETMPFYNYSELDLKTTDEGFTPSLVSEEGDAEGIGWRLLTKRGRIEVLNITGETQFYDLKTYGLATVAKRRIRISVNGRAVGVFELNNKRPTLISLNRIKIAPRAKARIELESLDGTDRMDLSAQEINASAAFSYFEILTDEN